MRVSRLLLILLPLAAGTLGIVAMGHATSEAQQVGAENALPTQTAPPVLELSPVEVLRVAPQALAEDLRISGSLRAATRTVLTARVAGTVAEVTVDVGDAVEAGQVLARFDTRDVESNLAEKRANLTAGQASLELAQLTAKRTRDLATRGNASQVSLQEAESQLANAEAQVLALQAQVAVAEQALRDSTVVAPFAGIVSSRSVEPGQRVGFDKELLGLMDLAEIEIQAGVPTSRIGQLRIGQMARLRVEGIDDRDFTAEVIRISPAADLGTRSVPVFLRIRNDDPRLRGGMFATGTVRLRETPAALALPPMAVRRDEDGPFALAIVAGTLERYPLELGQEWERGAWQEVTSGVSAGDVIVVAPLPQLAPGRNVTVAE